MAYNKDTDNEVRLTPKQEKFVDGILERKDTISSIFRRISKSKKLDKKCSRYTSKSINGK